MGMRWMVAAVMGAAMASPAMARTNIDVVGTVPDSIGSVTVTIDEDIVKARSELSLSRYEDEDVIGPRDAETVIDFTTETLIEDLQSAGLYEPGGPGALDVLITRVVADKPQFTDVGIARNLAAGSRARGGARFEATLSLDGEVGATIEFSEFEAFLDGIAAGTWSNARRAADLLGNRVVETIEEN